MYVQNVEKISIDIYKMVNVCVSMDTGKILVIQKRNVFSVFISKTNVYSNVL